MSTGCRPCFLLSKIEEYRPLRAAESTPIHRRWGQKWDQSIARNVRGSLGAEAPIPLLLLLSARRRWRDVAFQPHVDDDISIMLIIVRGVEHQDGTSSDFAFSVRPWRFHQLIEI